MTTKSIEPDFAPPVSRPADAPDACASRFRLLSLLNLAVVGGLTFAVGLLGMVAIRSLGLGGGIASIASGIVLSALVAISWYGAKIHTWLGVIERLYTT